ncbi:unnamed protein product [Soboliphyme baturini]|uniref:Prenylcysteine lyase domain-containing protein n=1 Tax=Soboliphyme baturini TaxID=241478 RepID=A0A3P8EE49_9BILA|nr:unnamed protein product [Soboliphyme baturini]
MKYYTVLAIIGAGIGGSSCAYFLRTLFGKQLLIDIFEKALPGGRTVTAKVGTCMYEAGGSVIHQQNLYMTQFRSLLSLDAVIHPSSNVKFAIVDGAELRYVHSTKPILRFLKPLWRYGLGLWRVDRHVRQMVQGLSHIYRLQDRGLAFTSVRNLLHGADPGLILEATGSLQSHLSLLGCRKRLVYELGQGITRLNYGQDVEIHGLVGLVAFAGMQPGLWSVKGGNHLVSSGLISKTRAHLRNSEVISVTRSSGGGYAVYSTSSSGAEKQVDVYDAGNLAVPADLSEKHRDFQYLLNCNSHDFYNSIGKVLPVSGKDPESQTVYKVFSGQPLSVDCLKSLFSRIDGIESREFLAYPCYAGTAVFPTFRIAPGLYHINAIEAAASCMEMIAIGARNVALLAYNEILNKNDSIDATVSKIRTKQETYGC